MATTYNFEDIYDYFYSQCTDEEKKQNATPKCDQFIQAMFAEFIIYVDSDASISYTAKTFTTTSNLTEIQKYLLGLMMYRELKKEKVTKQSTLSNLVSDSHKITGMGEIKKAVREDYENVNNKINDILATFL